MATQTIPLARFENGAVQFEIDYDDDLNRIISFRCVNSTRKAAWGALRRDGDKLEHFVRCAGQAISEATISKTDSASRVDYAKGERGFFSGCVQHYKYPA